MKYEKFRRIMRESQKDVSKKYPPKYRNHMQLYDRFGKALRFIASQGYRKGMDFGCAHAASVVLAKGYGLKVVGVDVGSTIYTKSQVSLKKMGYRIHIMDTHEQTQWQRFRDGQFDFVMCYFSICKGCQRSVEYGGRFASESDCLQARFAEIARVLRPGGGLFIWPTRHYKAFAKRPYSRIWSKKGIKTYKGK